MIIRDILADKSRLSGILSLQDVARSRVKDVSLEIQMLKQYIKNWPDGHRS